MADAVKITPGQAIMKGHYYALTEELQLEVSPTDEGRLDRVVLRWDNNLENRYIRLFIKEGSKDRPPFLERTGKVYEISLYQIQRKPGKAVIEPEDVIDERLNEALCGITTSLITIPTDVFLEDWEEFKKKYESWFLEVQDESFLTVKEHRQTTNELQRELAHLKMLQSASQRVKEGATFVTNFQDSTDVEVISIPRVTLTREANKGSFTLYVDKSSQIRVPGIFTLTSATASEVIEVKSKSGDSLTLSKSLSKSYPRGSELSKTQMTIEENNRRATFGGFGLTEYRNYIQKKVFTSERYQFDGEQYIYFMEGTVLRRLDLFTLNTEYISDLSKHPEYTTSAPLNFEGVVNGYFVLRKASRSSKEGLYTIEGLKRVESLEGEYTRVRFNPDNLNQVVVFISGDYFTSDFRLVTLSDKASDSEIRGIKPFQTPSHSINNELPRFKVFPQRDGSIYTLGRQGLSDKEYMSMNYWWSNSPQERITVTMTPHMRSNIHYCPHSKRLYEVLHRERSLTINRSDVIDFDTTQNSLEVTNERNWWVISGIDISTGGTPDIKILTEEPGKMILFLTGYRNESLIYLELDLINKRVLKNVTIEKSTHNFYNPEIMGLPSKYSGRNRGPFLYQDNSKNVYLDLDLTFGDGVGLLENDLYLRVKDSKNFATWVKTTSATMTEIQAGSITQKATYGRGEYQGIVSTLEPTNEVRLRFRRSSLTTSAQVNEIIGGVE